MEGSADGGGFRQGLPWSKAVAHPWARIRSGRAAGADKTRCGANALRSRDCARGWKPQTLQRARGARELRGGDAGVMSADYCTERGTRIPRTSAWRPLFPQSHPTLETQRSRKFRKRNCRRVSRSLGTVSQASRRRLCTPDTTDAVKAERPWPWRSLRTATFRVPGAPPSVFYAERAPAPSRSPGSGAVVGWAPAASRFRPRPPPPTIHTPPVPSYRKGKLGPCENPEECSL